MQTVNLGPFLLSVSVVAVLLGVIAGQAASAFLARRGHGKTENALWWLLLVALVAARIGYVARLWDSYAAHPLSMLNITDGGFDLVSGMLVLVLGVVVVAWRKKAWRLSLPVSAAVGLAVWGLVFGAVTQLQDASHPPLPDMTLHSLDGQPAQLGAFRGKPLVINLWATWCGPCRREMPVLVAAQQSRNDVHFVFADQGESADTIRKYLASNDLAPRNVLLDTGRKLSEHYRAPGYPTTLFFDASGHLRSLHIGALSRATLHARVKKVTPSPQSDGVTP